MRTAASLWGRLCDRLRADLVVVLALAALAAVAATTADAVGLRKQNNPDRCPPGLKLLQPVETGSYAVTYGGEAGTLSLVVRTTSQGPLVDFSTDGPTHLVDRVIVRRGDGGMTFDYRPAGTTSGTVHAHRNPSTGKYHVPSYLCVETRLKPPPPPVDVCPNIPGNQAEIPPGMIKDAQGNCVTPPPPPTDVCPNIPGIQETIPPGMIKDAQGNCVTPPPPPTDVCPNIPGIQETIPPGMIKDAQGNCVTPPPPPTDVCPNIPGIQETIPPGMIKDAQGNCVTPPPPPPPTDVCPNIGGVQESVPAGMVRDASGNCVTPPPPPPTDLCPNIAGVQETVPAGMVKDASGNCVTPPSPPPSIDLAVVKDDSVDPVTAGRNVLYTVTATNRSSVGATGVVVTDTVPAGLEILSVRASQGSCSTAGRTVTCRLGGLPAGSKAIVRILVRTSAPGVVTNFARVTGNEPDPRPGNNTTSETTRIVAPFQPPSAACDTVTVAGRRTVDVGVRTQLRIFVKARGRALAGERVRVRGAGIDVSARTNRRGVAVVWVRAKRPGVISVAVVGEPTCARRLGAVGRDQPDLTG
jgi:uncharacterized repeat protein (TIGR01451 family)